MEPKKTIKNRFETELTIMQALKEIVETIWYYKLFYKFWIERYGFNHV